MIHPPQAKPTALRTMANPKTLSGARLDSQKGRETTRNAASVRWIRRVLTGKENRPVRAIALGFSERSICLQEAMFSKTQLRKYATEWIERQPKGTVFHLYDLYKYLETTFPEECESAGVTVSDGKPHYESDARYGIRDCKDRGIIKHTRKGRWKEGFWQRT